MTDRTDKKTIARLNRSEPPPGYDVRESEVWIGWIWQRGDDTCRPARESRAAAIKAAWAQHQERNDPPGLTVHRFDADDAAGVTWAVQVLDCPIDGPRPPGPGVNWATPRDARAAAWAHYWRCVNLVEQALKAAQRRGFEVGAGSDWALCLAWPEEQLAREERELAEIEGAARA